ncbi:MAG: Na+/H+ antiporter [Myxococcota bacterium]
MHAEFLFVILFSVATAVAIGARWLKLPYTVALVLAGLALGTVKAFEPPHLTKELLFAVILPGLIFEAAFHLDAAKFWKEKTSIHALAIPGLIVAILATAAILVPAANALAFVTGFTFMHGLVFAALIAATDPIAVVGLFKSLGAPKRLAVMVEGESLLNDGTGVVVFTIILGAMAGGGISLGSAVVDFIRVAGLGALVGVAVGLAASHIIRNIDDAMIELTLTMVAAYGSFVLAERFHVSGVMAAVGAGMLCGNYAARTGMSPTTRVAVETFWEYLAFALNSVVFLLIGFEIHVDQLLASWLPIVIAWVAVMAGRALVVFVVTALLQRTSERVPWSWSTVVVWSGLRGALSMVLVLGLPQDFPHRVLLVNMTFGVVLLSILLQGLTMAPLLRRLKIVGVRSDEQQRYELERGRLKAAGAGLEEVERMRREHAAPSAVLDGLEAEYRRQVEQADAVLKSLHLERAEIRHEEERAARRRVLVAERDAALQAAQKGVVGSEALDSLLADIDARLTSLEDAPAPAPTASAPAPAPPDARAAGG